MCLSCGCGQPNDDHGDSRNITLNDIDQAAKAAGTTRDKVLQNITGGTDRSRLRQALHLVCLMGSRVIQINLQVHSYPRINLLLSQARRHRNWVLSQAQTGRRASRWAIPGAVVYKTHRQTNYSSGAALQDILGNSQSCSPDQVSGDHQNVTTQRLLWGRL